MAVSFVAGPYKDNTSSSLTVYVKGLDPAYKQDRNWTWTIGRVNTTIDTIYTRTTNGQTIASCTFQNLDPIRSYWVDVIQTNNMGNILIKDTIPSVYTKPTLWDWYESNGDDGYGTGQATREETRKAYNAILNKGAVSDFSYKVWNDLVQKVGSTIFYYGRESSRIDWDSFKYGLTERETKMTSSAKDRILTAQRFNSLRYNIGLYYSTSIFEVSSGDLVKGDYFITLANSLNNFIKYGP